jgi:hypothetical protein
VKLSKNLPLLTLTIVFSMSSANAQNKPAAVSVEQLAKTRHAAVYDGFELTDNKTKIKIPKGKPEWTFTLSDFDSNKFSRLKTVLGDAAFQKIVKKQGYKVPQNEFQSFAGIDNFGVYYFTRPDKQKGVTILILVSYGEYQPARYIANIEGIWRVKGAGF